jgi:hypothetical protein
VIEPFADLEPAEIVNVNPHHHWDETEQPNYQKVDIVRKHYQKQAEHCIIVSCNLLLYKE